MTKDEEIAMWRQRCLILYENANGRMRHMAKDWFHDAPHDGRVRVSGVPYTVNWPIGSKNEEKDEK